MKNRVYLWVIGVVFLAACSSGSGSNAGAQNPTYTSVDTAWTSGSNNAAFYMTDQYIGGTSITTGASANVAVSAATFSHVFVTVTEVDVNVSNDTNAAETTWVKTQIPAGKQKIDLLQFQNGATSLLTSANISAGTYQQVRLILAPNPASAPFANYVILASDTASANQIALTTPSGTQTGIKINNLSITTDSSKKLVVVLDFLVSQSIVAQGNGGYLLKPVPAININVGTVTSGSTTVSTTTQGSSNSGQ